MSTRDWALAYAALGWRVFPVVPRGKRPIYAGWQRDATTSPDLIARYWRADPGPNIGVICGEAFDAFDIEAEHLASVRDWTVEHHLAFTETPIERSGRGGVHVLVSPIGLGHGTNLYLAGRHIGELKSTGGFIVVAPSLTDAQYRWVRSPLETPVSAAPAWFGRLLITRTERPDPDRRGPWRKGTRRDLEALALAISQAGTGSRNNLLYWAMRRASEEAIPSAEAEAVLGRCAIDSGLTEREVAATIRSANSVRRR